MLYHSTKNPRSCVKLSQAILAGLADDGGLFVPQEFPVFTLTEFDESWPYHQFAATLLMPFFVEDQLAEHLPVICKEAFQFSVPLKPLTDDTLVLELFHGPTLSFKDFGARFLAACMTQLAKEQRITIMVATSGDTGSAVAAAFHQKPHIDVKVLFPEGKITKRQEQQITCWGDNVAAYAVQGVFDDCQRLVKSAFQQPTERFGHLSTANSINIARLLPQTTYYAYWSWHYYKKHGVKPSVIVPSGNFGNVTACFWAKQMGFPISQIVLATNANTVIEDYLATGEFTPRKSIATLANAMDVGNPSNFERLRYLFPDFNTFKQNVTAFSVSDQQIKQTILDYKNKHHYLICPHTATACYVREQLNNGPFIVVATADPCKFETIIEPLIAEKIPVPTRLQELLNRQHQVKHIAADLSLL